MEPQHTVDKHRYLTHMEVSEAEDSSSVSIYAIDSMVTVLVCTFKAHLQETEKFCQLQRLHGHLGQWFSTPVLRS